MPFARSSLQQITNRILSDFQTRITGATSLLRRSILGIIARVNAAAFHLQYEYLDYQARQLFISTADEAGLETHSSEYGIPRNAPTFATGSGTATGTTGTIILATSQLSNSDGLLYMMTANATIVAGSATIEFTALVSGEDYNDDAGILLTFVSPQTGVNSTVTVDSDGIAGGADEETNEELRARLLTRKRLPPHGGAAFDYLAWMLEVSGVTRSWLISEYQGIGTLGLIFVRDDDTSIIPSLTLRDAMKAYITSHTDPITGETVGAPVTAVPGIYMIEPTLLSVDLSVSLYQNTLAIRTAIIANVTDMILRDGGGGNTLYLSRISEAISLATNETRHVITLPVADIATTTTQIPVIGTITFSDY
jgi:uncharacterized phage protein gp47/JayE